MDDTSGGPIAVTLGGVGGRLHRLRTGRRMTLNGVSRATGISTSTLSRLERGERRPTLELLLALSHVYRVSLDDVVAPPDEGDPRTHLRAGVVRGRTVIPLTRQPGVMQAWKIVVPTSSVAPVLRSHEGHEWIYVLSGQVRLLLGNGQRMLAPGDMIEFDTGEPHWFGNAGEQAAEILSIFGRPGERMTSRTPPARHGRGPWPDAGDHRPDI